MQAVGNPRRGAPSGGLPQPFSLRQLFWPLNLGDQRPYWQAAGPRDGNTTVDIRPWPYLTGFKNFIAGMPYGVASSRVGNAGRAVNLGAAVPAFLPIGYIKPQTGTISYF